MDELLVFAHSCSPDIIALTESWTHEGISDQQILVPGYSQPYRHDRSDGRKGGGVCCYVKSSLPSSLTVFAPFECPPEIQSIWLRLPTLKLVCAVLYVPPNLRVEVYKRIVDYIVNMSDWTNGRDGNYDKLILAGDFNQLPTDDFETVLGLTQVVQEPTRDKAILDKIFLNTQSALLYSKPVTGPNFGKADHKSIMLKPKSNLPSTSHYVKLYDYRQSFLDSFFAKLASLPWDDFYTLDVDLQTKCNIFYSWLDECKKEIPFTFVEMKSTDKAWMTPLLKKIIDLKHEAFRKKQFHLFNHYKQKLSKEIPLAKANWTRKQKESPKKIWNIVKSISNKESPSLGSLNSLISHFPSASDTADAINDKFADVFSATPNWNEVTSLLKDDDSWHVDTSVNVVFRELIRLDTSKSGGSDGISPRLLKEGASILAAPVAHLLSLSIQDASVPTQWKSANIIPLPKSSSVTLENLRPISLLPTLAKILEKRVLESVKDQLISAYGSNQFGFRPKTGTLDALISLTDFVTSELDLASTSGVAIVSFDMSRAFDRLPYDKLFCSLLASGVPHSFLKWCVSYFQNRRQRVVLRGEALSSFKEITSGVPQGSILSPYFFACHMGSLQTACPKTRMIKYADDVAIAIPYNSVQDAERLLKKELDNMEDWCGDKGLQLNKAKTKVMYVGKKLHEKPSFLQLESTNTLRILGITLRNDLKWNTHIENVCKTAAKRMYILKQLKSLPDVQKRDLLQVYSAHIQSILEYNSPLFVGTSKENIKKMEKIRKRAHRMICDFECTCDILPSLAQRREQAAISTLKKYLRPHHLLHNIVPPILPRTNYLQIPYTNTDRRGKSFIPRASLLYNDYLTSAP